MSTTPPRPNKGTDEELPLNWTETTTTTIARFERDDSAVVRVKHDFAAQSLEEYNCASQVGADGQVYGLFNQGPLPSSSEELHRGGTPADGRSAEMTFICHSAERELVHPEGGSMNCVLSCRQTPTYEARKQCYCDADALEHCPDCGSSHPVDRINGDEGECPQQ